MPLPRPPLAAIVAVSALVTGSTLFGFPPPPVVAATQASADHADLATADLRVVDKDGKAVTDLAQGDVVVTLDGQPREVVSFRPPATPPLGRVIFLLFDDLSTASAQPKTLTDAADRLLAGLKDTDLVGLATTSGLGPSVALTHDRAVVAAALHNAALIGRADARPLKPFVAANEAFDMVRTGGNKDTGAKVVQRECSAGGGSGAGGGGKSRSGSGGGGGGGSADDSCATRIVAMARAEALLAEQTTGRQIAAYIRLIASLHGSPGPRSLVVLSGGLALPLGTSDALTVVGRAAAESEVALYGLVSIDEVDLSTEASSDRLKARHDEDTFLATGVDSVAAATGGEGFRLTAGDAEGIASRILAATDSVYQIGVAKPAGSARYFALKVSTKLPGRVTRTPEEAVALSVEVPAAPPADALTQRIEQGGTRFGVPIALTTSRRRDTSATRVQLAVSADVPASTPAPVSAMFALIDGTGKVVQSGRKDLVPAPGDDYRLALTLPVDAGDYRLRLAVADGHGNVGSLDDVVAARLPRLGALAASDLVTASSRADVPPRLLAFETLPAAAQALHVSLELYPDAADANALKVQLTLAPASGGPPIAGGEVPGALRDGRYVIAVTLPVAAMKADRYLLTATVLVSGKPAGTLTAVVRKPQ